MTDNIITGAGGGGKGGGSSHVATEDQDNLRSMQIADVVDLICEGPVYGLSDGMRSVFINETPLMNDDGTMNFKNVAIEWRNGSQIQSPLTGVIGQEFEQAVSVIVKADAAIVRTITNPSVNMARVTVSTPQLTEQDKSTGDIHGSAVSFKIEVQNNGAGYSTAVVDTINGKTTSKYQRAYLFELPGSGPWDVRVTRITPDSTSSAIQNDLYWDSYTGIVKSQMTYPNSVLVHTRIDSSQFNAIPNRGYGMKGLIVKVPSNYDPLQKAYSGTWDGTFVLAWTDNPAWCFYDLLTNERYGVGHYLNVTNLDKWLMYSIGQYCDELVPDGYGFYEPRFRCNLFLQTRNEAYSLIQNMASIFRGITFWGGGAVHTLQDRPSDPVALYSAANVVDAKFVYSGSSLKQRHTVALVSWNDPKDFFRQKVEYVQDDEGVKKYGIIETEIMAFGCTSRGQAHRYGKWILAIEKYCQETVTFKAGLDSCELYPGAVFMTSDPVRAGIRLGGRIKSYDTNTVVLDASITLEAGRQYKIHIIGEDTIPQTFDVTTGASTTDTLTLATNITTPLVDKAMYIISIDNLVPETWRVVGVKDSGDNIVEISAVSYNEQLYDFVELNNRFVLPPISNIKVRPGKPQNLNLIVGAYLVGGQIAGLTGTLSWTGDSPRYYVRWRRINGAWNERYVTETSMDVGILTSDPYTFIVVAVAPVSGIESEPTTLNITPSLDSVTLPNVTGLSLDGPFTIESVNFKWDPVSGADSYETEIYTLDVMRRSQNIGNSLKYSYSSANMRADGGPWRIVKFRVRARGRFGSKSEWAEIEVGNAQIGPLEGIDVQSGVKSIFFQCEKPTDPDFVGIIIWVGTTPHFSPNSTNQVYDGPDLFKALYQLTDGSTLVGDTTYYVRAAGYDDFGKDSLIISNSFAVAPAKNAPDKDSIESDMIKDGALTIAKFADSIQPTLLVDTIGDGNTYLDSWTVFAKDTHKLYKWTGDKYEYKVGAGDLYADSVTAGVIAAGAVNAREIAAGAITAEKLYIVSRGAALNADPSMSDATAWTYDDKLTFVKLTDGTIGNWAARSLNGFPTILKSIDMIPVNFKKSYRIRVNARRNSSANGTFSIGVELFDTNGNRILDDNSNLYWFFAAVAITPSMSWTEYSDAMNNPVTRVFPTATKYMRLVALLNTAGNTGYHEIQDYRVEEILDGTLIKDGAISTAKLAAGSVTADKLLANSITGDKLVANSITGDKIAAESITADKLAAGAITADNLSAGSITADKIDGRGLIIRDYYGVPILGVGHSLGLSYIQGLGRLAVLDGIDKSNIDFYVGVAAIGSAFIDNLAVKSAHIDNLTVGTNKIAFGAVSTNVGSIGSPSTSVSISTSGGSVAVFGKAKCTNPSGGNGSGFITMQLFANGASLSIEQNYTFDDSTGSVSSFTLHQPPAGVVMTYQITGSHDFNTLEQATVQILVVEFKR